MGAVLAQAGTEQNGISSDEGNGEIGWICVLAAFPFALCGFFTYNGMTFEKFLLAIVRSELLYPRKLVFRAENLYSDRKERLQYLTAGTAGTAPQKAGYGAITGRAAEIVTAALAMLYFEKSKQN